MRCILVLAFGLSIIGCGSPQSKTAEEPYCHVHSTGVTLTYPDGIDRVSIQYLCKDACTHNVAIDDPTKKYAECADGIHDGE